MWYLPRFASILGSITLLLFACWGTTSHAALTMSLEPQDATTSAPSASAPASAAAAAAAASAPAPAATAPLQAEIEELSLGSYRDHSTKDTPPEATATPPEATASSTPTAPSTDAPTTTEPSSSLIKDPEHKIYRDAFGNRISHPVVSTLEQDSTTTGNTAPTTQSNAATTGATTDAAAEEHLKVAVVYFSNPEMLEHETMDVDELSGASVIYDNKNQRRGLVEYLAMLIGETTKGDLYSIARIRPYPLDHDELIYEVSEELDVRARPSIIVQPTFKPERYDVIFIGYPIWWYDLPMPLYTFFEHYDLSGKIIVPFCSHGGSRPFKTFALIDKEEPNAQVLYNYGLVMNRLDIPEKAPKVVAEWLHGLKLGMLSKEHGAMPPKSLIRTTTKPQTSQTHSQGQAQSTQDHGSQPSHTINDPDHATDASAIVPTQETPNTGHLTARN